MIPVYKEGEEYFGPLTGEESDVELSKNRSGYEMI